jgi:hypothetical protein
MKRTRDEIDIYCLNKSSNTKQRLIYKKSCVLSIIFPRLPDNILKKLFILIQGNYTMIVLMFLSIEFYKYATNNIDHPGRARMTCGRSPHHGRAMTWSLCDHHPGGARMTCGRSPHHGRAMTCGQSPHHPGGARMTCGLRPHHNHRKRLILKFNKLFVVPNGYTNLIEWNIKYLNYSIKLNDDNLCSIAIKNNMFKMVKWLNIEKSCRLDPKTINKSIKNDNLEIFNWLIIMGVPITKKSIELASIHSLNILKEIFNMISLESIGSLETYFGNAAKNNNLGIVDYLMYKKKFKPTNKILFWLLKDKCYNMFNYLVPFYDYNTEGFEHLGFARMTSDLAQSARAAELCSDHTNTTTNSTITTTTTTTTTTRHTTNQYTMIKLNDEDHKRWCNKMIWFHLGFSGDYQIVERLINMQKFKFDLADHSELITGAISYGDLSFFKSIIIILKVRTINYIEILMGITWSKNRDNVILEIGALPRSFGAKPRF